VQEGGLPVPKLNGSGTVKEASIQSKSVGVCSFEPVFISAILLFVFRRIAASPAHFLSFLLPLQFQRFDRRHLLTLFPDTCYGCNEAKLTISRSVGCAFTCADRTDPRLAVRQGAGPHVVLTPVMELFTQALVQKTYP
jgi:hypothetical protein